MSDKQDKHRDYKVSDLAAMFDVEQRTIIRWIEQGHFPGAYRTKPGGHYRIPPAAVIAFDKKRREIN